MEKSPVHPRPDLRLGQIWIANQVRNEIDILYLVSKEKDIQEFKALALFNNDSWNPLASQDQGLARHLQIPAKAPDNYQWQTVAEHDHERQLKSGKSPEPFILKEGVEFDLRLSQFRVALAGVKQAFLYLFGQTRVTRVTQLVAVFTSQWSPVPLNGNIGNISPLDVPEHLRWLLIAEHQELIKVYSMQPTKRLLTKTKLPSVPRPANTSAD